jgi:uncharacterized protein (TIGR03437 family)
MMREPVAGQAPPPMPNATANPVQVLIGGKQAQVLYAGLTPRYPEDT